MLLGGRRIRSWCRQQQVAALSSAEAETYALVCASCEGLGIQPLFRDFGIDVKIQVFLDANAANGIIERKGLSKVRHLDTEHLWLQQEQARRLLPLAKVDGTLNVADLMTKYLPEQ